MPFVIIFLVLAGAAAIYVLYPHLRKMALMFILLFGAILAYVVVDEVLDRGLGPQELTAADLTLADVALAEDLRYLRLTGRVTNGSADRTLREFTLRLTEFDCPAADTPRADCAIIAQNTGIARVDVPPGQTRDFEAIVRFTSRTVPKGVPAWQEEITAVRGLAPVR